MKCEKLSSPVELRHEKLISIVGTMAIIGQQMEEKYGEQVVYPPATETIDGLGKIMFLSIGESRWVRISQLATDKKAEVDIHFTKQDSGNWSLRQDEEAKHAITFQVSGDPHIPYYPLAVKDDGKIDIQQTYEGVEIDHNDLHAAAEFADTIGLLITEN